MTRQRRQGEIVQIYPTSSRTDERGNTVRAVTTDDPIVTRAAFVSPDGARLQVAGQVTAHTVTMLVGQDAGSRIDAYSRVKRADGSEWDVTAPPTYHQGANRSVRHWTVELRQRQ